MAFDIGELLAKLHIDPTQFNEEVAKAKAKMKETGDSASGLHKAMGNVMQGIGMGAGNLLFQGLSGAASFAKDAVFGFNAELQNSGIAFTTMLGSGQKAQVFLDQLKAFAKSTPFSFGDLVTNAQNMMGMGIAAQDVIPDLTALGDSVASVGGSAEQVKQVTLAFDQMNAKGTVDLGNMNQLMEGGVPNALKIMAAGYHKTTGEMISMISTGKIQSSVALPMLIQGLEKGTASTAALGGMMDKQSQTFTGALSNIQDGLQQAIAGAFKPFFDVASSGAQALGTFFSGAKFGEFGASAQTGMTKAFAAIKAFNFSPIIAGFHNVVNVVKKDVIPIGKDIVKTFGPPIVTAFGMIYGAIGPITGALKPIGDVLKSIFDFMGSHATTFQAIAVGILAVVVAQKLWTAATEAWTMVTKAAAAAQVLLDIAMDANPIGLIVLAVIGLAAAFIYLWTHSAAFRDFWIGLWGYIWGFLKTIGAWFAGPFADFFVNAFHFVMGQLSWFWATTVSIWNAIWGFIKGVGAWFAGPFAGFFVAGFHMVVSAADSLRSGVVSIWNSIKGAAQSVANAIGSFFSGMGHTIASAWGSAVDGAKSAINTLVGLANRAIGAVNGIIGSINSIPGISVPSVPSIPKLAGGGKVSPRGGGTPVVMGDGGQVEYGVPKSDMESIIGQAVAASGGQGGGVLTIMIRGDGILAGIRKQIRVQGGDVQTVLVGQ